MKGWADFRAVKQAVSLEMVLRHYEVLGLRRRRDQLAGRCPIHHGQREDSFRASLGKNAFHCFACQASGNVLDFVAAMENCSIREAALRLQKWFAGPVPVASVERPQLELHEAQAGQLVRKKEGSNPPLRFALRGVDPAHPYLAQRGIDHATAVEFGVGFYAGTGLLSGRIVIPIRNQCGQIVAYAGRALDGRPPKYKLPAGFRKALELFNLHRAAGVRSGVPSGPGSKSVVLVEGYFDCMRVHQAGFSRVVALMGSSLSVAQERALLRHFEQVILMLDGDAPGRAASQAIAARLSARCSVGVACVPDGVQPDQMSSLAIRKVLGSAIMHSGLPDWKMAW